MVNFKKEDFAFTELLQVRISPITKKQIEQHILRINKTGKKYSQSDFLRDCIISKLEGKTKDIEKKIITGTLMGQEILQGLKEGEKPKITMTRIIAESLLQFEDYREKLELVKQKQLELMDKEIEREE